MCWGYQLLIIASTKRPRTDQQKNCHGQSLEKKKGRTINFDVKENHKEQTIPVLHLCIATVREHLLINFINQFQQFLFPILEQWSPLLQNMEYLQNASSGCFGIFTSITIFSCTFQILQATVKSRRAPPSNLTCYTP
jgi:hypothetical protein